MTFLTQLSTCYNSVLHNSGNMDPRVLPDMYELAFGPAALGLVHTYQANYSCPCYNYNMYIICMIALDNRDLPEKQWHPQFIHC